MDVGSSQSEDAVFSDASLVFSSRDFDAVRQGVARIFKPHLLRLHGTSADLRARMHHLRQGSASVNRLEYGAEVEIDPDRLDDFFLVQIPVAGHASIACGNVRFELHAASRVAGLADIAAAHALARRQRTGLRALRAQSGRAALCGRISATRSIEPLEFEPELRLDTPAGQYFLRLVNLFAEELMLARQSGDRAAHPLANEHVAEHFSSALLNALIYGQKSNMSAALARSEGVAGAALRPPTRKITSGNTMPSL